MKQIQEFKNYDGDHKQDEGKKERSKTSDDKKYGKISKKDL